MAVLEGPAQRATANIRPLRRLRLPLLPPSEYLSQKQKTASRKRLTAAKLRLKLVGWPDIREPMPSSPNGSTAEPINAFATRSKPWKPKPIKHASASRSTFAPSPITSESCAVIEFPRVEPPLGLNQGNHQHLVSTTFGCPSEARDLAGGP